jgi:hypothetical protein
VSNTFASGKNALGVCDRCGFQYRLRTLKALTIKANKVNLLVCTTCWEPDQPQLSLGMYPVFDPQGLHNPRNDRSYYAPAPGGDGGSRITEWGWNPVGLQDAPVGFVNSLVSQALVGTLS